MNKLLNRDFFAQPPMFYMEFYVRLRSLVEFSARKDKSIGLLQLTRRILENPPYSLSTIEFTQ